jgi:hypothetical protein
LRLTQSEGPQVAGPSLRGGSPRFDGSARPGVPLSEETHRLVVLTEETDWTELERRLEQIRRSKLKSATGRPPHLRALIGALVLKATRDMTWREAEDLIRHYAPARYLCGLTETEWTPDFTTLHEYAVQWAVKEKLADPSVVVGDTTAQEAAIPYPNAMRLMAAFMTSVAAASKKAGQSLKEFAGRAAKHFKAAAPEGRCGPVMPEEVQQGGAGQGDAVAPDDEEAVASNRLLASHREGGCQQESSPGTLRPDDGHVRADGCAGLQLE